jgi:phage baseplate assembly protein W
MQRFGVKIPLISLRGEGVFLEIETAREEIRQNFKNLLLTSPGERVRDLNFGCGLKRVLFEPGIVAEEVLPVLIGKQISQYLPVIKVEKIIIKTNGNKLGVVISYFVPDLSYSDTLEFFFGE